MAESRRAPRRDAIANRERILVGAEQYFAEAGLDASLHELCRRVGIGVGTLYRHFPNHDALVRALYDRAVTRLDRVQEQTEAVADGWGQIVAFLDGSYEVFREMPATASVMQRMMRIDPGYRPGRRWEQPMREMVARAHAEGQLRADVTATDVATLPFLLSGVLRFPEPARGVAYARLRSVVLGGLRAGAESTDPLPGSALNVDQFHVAAHSQVVLHEA